MKARDDLVGHTIGKLTVVGVGKTAAGYRGFVCECVCGQRKTIKGSELRYGHVTTCGCRSAKRRDEFPNGIVRLEKASGAGRSNTWRFRCFCGAEFVSQTAYVRRGNKSSCGCFESFMVGLRSEALAA